MIWDNYFNQMQEPVEKVLELNKVKKLQKVSRLSSVTMYSKCFTTEYSLSLMSKVRKNLLVNYLAEIATIECRDQLIMVFCPSESWFADYLVSLKLVVRSFWVQEFESGPTESLGERWISRRERLTFFTVEILLSLSRQLKVTCFFSDREALNLYVRIEFPVKNHFELTA